MLIGINPALNADVLYVLASMGHGDQLVICDTNFPADTVAKQTAHGKVVRMDNLSAPAAIKAVLTVLPLDTFIDHPVERMEVVGDATKVLPIAAEVQAEVTAAFKRQTGKDVQLASIERFQFYERAKKSYAVIVTGELRFYGCFILTKGVIPPPPELK
jgi:L-fucose mutarotase